MIKEFEYPKYYLVRIDDETGDVKVISNSKHSKGRELKQYFNPDKYLRCKMNNRHVLIHHLVAKHFLGDRPEGMVINHKDGVKTNNRPANLEYVSIAENIKHSMKMGMHICSTPEQLSTYKDGRTRDKVKYKHEWYVQNRARILKKVKDRYQQKKLEE